MSKLKFACQHSPPQLGSHFKTQSYYNLIYGIQLLSKDATNSTYQILDTLLPYNFASGPKVCKSRLLCLCFLLTHQQCKLLLQCRTSYMHTYITLPISESSVYTLNIPMMTLNTLLTHYQAHMANNEMLIRNSGSKICYVHMFKQ